VTGPACHLLKAGVDTVTIKNILGHVLMQTTQHYVEMSQDSVDKKFKKWKDTWFGKLNMIFLCNMYEIIKMYSTEK
jgi:integrase